MARTANGTKPTDATVSARPGAKDLTEAKAEPIKPQKWWQWVLLYPALAITVLSSVPTYIELVGSTWLGVPFGQYKNAAKENELWKENIDCAAAPFDGLTNRNNVAVDAVVCLSGNVLVRVKPPEQRTTYKWVALESISPNKTAFGIIGLANAKSDLRHQDDSLRPLQLAQGNLMVICQQWIGNGILRRRIRDLRANSCYDEVVNTFTGQVLSTAVAPCAC